MNTDKFIRQLASFEFTFENGVWQAKNVQLSLLESALDCSIRFAIPDPPDDALLQIYLVEAKTRNKERLALLKEFEELLPKLKKRVLPPMPDLKSRVSASYDEQTFSAINKELQAILRQPGRTPKEQCVTATPILEKSITFLKTVNFPQEVRRDDSHFYTAIGILNMQAHGFRDKVAAGSDAESCLEVLDRYIAALEEQIDLIDAYSAEVRGLARPMTPEESWAIMELEDELDEDETPLKRRLELCRKLLAEPLVSPEDKIKYIETIVEAIEEAEEREAEEAPETDEAREPEPDYPAEFIPLMRKAATVLNRVEKLGSESFSALLADRTLEALSVEHPGATLPDKAKLVAAIKPEGIEMEIQEGKPVETALLFSGPRNVFAGQRLRVHLEDVDIKDLFLPENLSLPLDSASEDGSLGREYVRQLKKSSLAHGIRDFAFTHGATEKDLEKLKKAYPEVPQSLLELLAEVDGTYYRDYGGKKVTLYVFGGILPYYLNSVEQMLGKTLYNAPDAVFENRKELDTLLSARADSIAEIYGEEYLEELVGPGIDPCQPLSRMLHISDCMNNGGSSSLYIDFYPAKGGVKGQIVRYVHDPDVYTVIAPGFDAFLKDNLKTGFDFLDEDEE